MTKITDLTPILEGVSLQLPPTPPPNTEYDFRQILTTTPTHPATSTLFRRYTLLLSYLLASFTTSPDDDNKTPSLSTLSSKSHPHHTAELEVQILQIEKRFDQLSELIPTTISIIDGSTTTTHDITWSPSPSCNGFADAVKNSLRAKPVEAFNPQGVKLRVNIHFKNDLQDGDFEARFTKLWKEVERLQSIIEELLTVGEGTLEVARGEVGFVPDVLGWKLTGDKVEAYHDKRGGGGVKKLRKEVATKRVEKGDSAIVRIHTMFPSRDGERKYQRFTGWLIDQKTVVTTGSAVYNHKHGFAEAVTIDIHDWDTLQGTHCGVHWGFFIAADKSFDLGVIRLDREIGGAGPLKFRNPPYRGENITVTVRGFLGRLDHQRNETREGTTEVVCDMEDNQRLLDHDVAVAPGSTGSPVMDQGGYVIGMHQGTGYNQDNQLVNKALTFDLFSNRPAAFKVALDFLEDPLNCMDKIAKLRVKPMRTEQMRKGLCRIQFRGRTKWYKGDI
ncbi:trypsin-like cysteine/serine peptidase domain-containing protein [Triangularia setosa]|uniref:Trypsin-like cysteine/serine peptidase domain-containing protein n=1 Tax=Triangularia setosa TaxID=2587417 RepID=A0AAN7A6L3_9PEZI|nr:trypsin-like cysteine/serine peptidase domain-containing protein [Podospora setosa]